MYGLYEEGDQRISLVTLFINTPLYAVQAAVIILLTSPQMRLAVSSGARGRPWPREREGPTSVARWEG